MKSSRGEKLFYAINEMFLVVIGLICLAPLIHVMAVSFSSSNAVAAGQVYFWPKQFTTFTYQYILENHKFWTGLYTSALRTVIGTTFNLLLTALIAYPLSKDVSRFRYRTFFSWFVFVPMILNGGLIPTYMLVKEVGLIDSIWALILPMAVPVFYVLVMLNFFRGLPIELEEAAIVDGAGHWRILFTIFVPLSLPAFATIAVYAILQHWNSWFDGLIYMNDPKNYPLMTYLQTAVLRIDWESLTADEAARLAKLGDRAYRSAQMFLGCLPVLMIYPFFQKYFVKGLVLGSVKG